MLKVLARAPPLIRNACFRVTGQNLTSLTEGEEILVVGSKAAAVRCLLTDTQLQLGTHTHAKNYAHSFGKTQDFRINPNEKGKKKNPTHTAAFPTNPMIAGVEFV